jgi:transcriptional regulator with PAS, ATPase and Fis domain
VAVNCATIPDHLAEAELFGYARGAFTGASRENRGFFRAANGGTLLLDEFGELPASVQPKLLRVLELGELIPLGECHPVRVDVRLVVASQEPLSRAVAERRLRPDLYARLDGIKVELPPLRERIEDAPALFLHFLAQASAERAPALQPELVERLCLYDWPFNGREVESLARRLMVLHRNADRLGSSQVVSHLREQAAGEPRERETLPAPGDAAGTSLEPERGKARDARDWAALGAALRTCSGNVARACAEVGISRARAYRLMHRSGGVDLGALRNGVKSGDDPGADEVPG